MKALVLSGGGAKGSFQLGVLKSLLEQEQNLDYDCYIGISVGALNCSLLATGQLKETIIELENVWLNKVKGNHSVWKHHLLIYIFICIGIILLLLGAAFISFILSAAKWITIIFLILSAAALYLPYYALMNTHAIYRIDPLKELIKNNLDVKKLRLSGKRLRVGAVSFESGQYYSATEQDENIVDWILASSAFPVFFPMAEIDNNHWTDGGVVDIAPLADAIALGATEIDVILTSPIVPSKKEDLPGIPGQLMRILELMSTEILKNDIKSKCSKYKDLKIRIFMPDNYLTNNSLDFSPEKLRYMYNEGIRMANQPILSEQL